MLLKLLRVRHTNVLRLGLHAMTMHQRLKVNNLMIHPTRNRIFFRFILPSHSLSPLLLRCRLDIRLKDSIHFPSQCFGNKYKHPPINSITNTRCFSHGYDRVQQQDQRVGQLPTIQQFDHISVEICRLIEWGLCQRDVSF